MRNLGDLEYNNLIELLDYLESISGSDIYEEKKAFAEDKIWKFFPNLTFIQELEFSYIINERDEKAFQEFKSNYPNILIDESGKSTPSDKDYWEVKEKALEMAYSIAYEKLRSNGFKDDSLHKVNSQVYNSKNLSGLKNIELNNKPPYLMLRKLFVDKHEDMLVNYKTFERYERILKDLDIDVNLFLGLTIMYCNGKQYDEFSIFLEHLLRRIDVLHADKELKSVHTKEFLDNIHSVINKNN
jgi:hypothetical protein